MEVISLKEAAALVNKDESTIRKFFNKRENQEHKRLIKGRMLVSVDVLMEQYGEQGQERLGTPRNSAEDSGLVIPNKPDVGAALQALVSQLEAKDNQIADLLARLQESNLNQTRALQQNNHRPEQEESLATEMLLEQLNRKDGELAELNMKLQESLKPKERKLDYVLLGVILVLLVALVVVIYFQA